MAVVAWLVWKRGGFAGQRRPLTIFLVQLTLNAVWTPLFFGLHWLGVAFAEIVLLCLAIAATIAAFGPVSRVAEWLRAPYHAAKFFSSIELITLLADREWLDDATKTIGQF
ncbi:MAG: TspO/MBR family protein [Verrucomicrobiota bacterium]